MMLATKRPVLPTPAVVAVLGNGSEKQHLPAQLIEARGCWMTLQMETPLAAGAPLRVDVQGGLVLGTAAAAESTAEGFQVRVEIDQVIPDTAGLARLISAVLGITPPVGLVHEPAPDKVMQPAPR
jgi:hypothetical protein